MRESLKSSARKRRVGTALQLGFLLVSLLIFIALATFFKARGRHAGNEIDALKTSPTQANQAPPTSTSIAQAMMSPAPAIPAQNPLQNSNASNVAPISADSTSALAKAFRNAMVLQMSPKANPGFEAEIRQWVKNLSTSELQRLGQRAIDENADNNERNAALFVLMQAGSAAIVPLSDIASQPVHAYDESDPHGAGALQKKFEVALRVNALDALDRMSTGHGTAVQTVSQQVARIASEQSQPTVQFLAQVSLSGIREGRPGKLQRFTDHVFEEGVSK